MKSVAGETIVLDRDEIATILTWYANMCTLVVPDQADTDLAMFLGAAYGENWNRERRANRDA